MALARAISLLRARLPLCFCLGALLLCRFSPLLGRFAGASSLFFHGLLALGLALSRSFNSSLSLFTSLRLSLTLSLHCFLTALFGCLLLSFALTLDVFLPLLGLLTRFGCLLLSVALALEIFLPALGGFSFALLAFLFSRLGSLSALLFPSGLYLRLTLLLSLRLLLLTLLACR